MSAEAGWNSAVLDRYERALWNRTPLRVDDDAGDLATFDVQRWLRPPDPADETMLARCTGPTLDIGCGPGRLVAALTARGVPALGVDVAAAAVALTRSAGALALRRSVFDRVPGAGRWQMALLADGNIGIGGNVGGLLSRIRDLLAPGAGAVVEVDGEDTSQRLTVRLVGAAGQQVATFPWARVGARTLVDTAAGCGFRPAERWTAHGRSFVNLQRI
ncbi:MAG TPA: SAM-dependent methyltransferase [Sporichthyaceae bacterium]|jgi:SAM-dependent methyltransferase|nr:SAM-dependent methyltransferase [Sporichthyaceae bacterium]